MSGFAPEPTPPPADWAEFLAAVHRADRFIQSNVVWRTDFSAPRDPPTNPPTFEFCGWRVYKPTR